jgi:hypothetical protein
MSDFNLINYNGRDIETREDIMWVCEEVTKAYKNGSPKLKDKVVLQWLREIHQEMKDGVFGTIDNRFEILDIRDNI